MTALRRRSRSCRMSEAWVYDDVVVRFARGEMDWANDEFRVTLHDDSYDPSQEADSTRADLGPSEVAASGSYKPGGARLLGRGVVRSALGGQIRLTAGT